MPTGNSIIIAQSAITIYMSNEQNTGFPKKDARFSKIKNIPDLQSDDKEGKIIEMSTFNI